MSAAADPSRYAIHPATPDRWEDLEGLFGPKGVQGGCWCMWFRQSGAQHRERAGEGNRRALEALVRGARPGEPAPGLLAYDGGLAVGWCALAPREGYPRLRRSPVAKPLDDLPTWAVTCFFVRAGYRRKGVAGALLDAATDYAVAHGARIVEGFPVDFTRRAWHPDEAYYGTPEMFERAGYTEVARRHPSRPYMRYQAKG